MSKRNKNRPDLDEIMSRLIAKQMIERILGDDNGESSIERADGQIVGPCYDDCFTNNNGTIELITRDIPLSVRAVAIGTHEADVGYAPKDEHEMGRTAFNVLTENTLGKGYLQVMEDMTVFLCIDGLHIMLDISQITDALMEQRDTLATMRAGYNELNPPPTKPRTAHK